MEDQIEPIEVIGDKIDPTVETLIDELKDKLEDIGEFDKKPEMPNSRSDLSIVSSQMKKLMGPAEKEGTTTSSEDSSLSSSSSTSSDEDEEGESKNKRRGKKVLVAKLPAVVSSSDSDDDDDEDENRNRQQRTQVKYVKTKEEVTIDEMPPVEVIDVTLEPDVKLLQMGKILSKVDKLVVVQSLPTTASESGQQQQHQQSQEKKQNPNLVAPLNEETVLFDANRKSIGKIFEIFGPVAGPFYSVRFNSLAEIESRGLEVSVGAPIFYAPIRTDYTKFIFNVDEMRREKGSDASWLNDNEPPPECLDYSDDEAERFAKKKGNKKQTAAGDDQETTEDESETRPGGMKRGANGSNRSNQQRQTVQSANGPGNNRPRQQANFGQQPRYNNPNYHSNNYNDNSRQIRQQQQQPQYPMANNNGYWMPPPQTQQFMNYQTASAFPQQQHFPMANFQPQFHPSFYPPPFMNNPLMQVGLAAANFGFMPPQNQHQQQQFSMMYSNQSQNQNNNRQRHFNTNNTNNNNTSNNNDISGETTQTNPVVDRRFIQDQSYTKKKAF